MEKDVKNPIEQEISVGFVGSYGSYLSGLPIHNAEELQANYEYLKDFAAWAIDNKVCLSCRFPWKKKSLSQCECGKYLENKSKIDRAAEEAIPIFDYDNEHTIKLALQMEEDLKGNSEYARLNRKARKIINDRIYRESHKTFLRKILSKRTWYGWFKKAVNVVNFLRPSYWKIRDVKSKDDIRTVPLFDATDEDVRSMTFGNVSQNCCVRTKGGCVVVVPSNQINDFKDKYKDAEIVKPKIKS